MLSTATDAPIAFLSGPHITSDAYTAISLVSGDSLLNSLVYRLYQLDPTQLVASSVAPTVGSPITVMSGIYVGASLTMRSADVFFLLNTNIKNFKIETCPDFGLGNTWATAVDYSVTSLATANLIAPIASPVAYNGIRLTVYTTQGSGADPISLAVFNAALLLYQPTRGFHTFKANPTQTAREVLLADKTTDTAYIYWSDGSFTLNEIALTFDLLTIADKTGIESIINAPDPFLVFVEPDFNPQELYLCKVVPGGYQPEFSTQFKGSGYKISLRLKQIGWI